MTVKAEGKSKQKESGAGKDAQVVTIKVHICGLEKVWRKIAVKGTATLNDLSDGIFDAFNREEMHLYTFFMTRKKVKDIRAAMKFTKYSNDDESDDELAQTTSIESLSLKPGEVFYYLFDYGDEWWHEITVESVEPGSARAAKVKLLESVGESPAQYEDEDAEDDEEDEDDDDDDDDFDDEDDEDDEDIEDIDEEDQDELDSIDKKPAPMSIPFPAAPKSGGKGGGGKGGKR